MIIKENSTSSGEYTLSYRCKNYSYIMRDALNDALFGYEDIQNVETDYNLDDKANELLKDQLNAHFSKWDIETDIGNDGETILIYVYNVTDIQALANSINKVIYKYGVNIIMSIELTCNGEDDEYIESELDQTINLYDYELESIDKD